MDLFSVIPLKIISVLFSVILGFIAGKTNKIENASIINLIFYFISPVVFFAAPANTKLNLSEISIVIIIFFVSSILCIISYFILKNVSLTEENSRNILAFAAGTGNCGYFLLPIAMMVFNNYTLSLFMMAIIGLVLYESSVGFYFCTYGNSSFKESIKRICKLPTLISFILGCIMSISGFKLPNFFAEFINNMRSAYSILGMMTIGLALSSLKSFNIDIKFSFIALFVKHIIYPLVIYVLIVADKFILHLYDKQFYNALHMISIAPVAGVTIIMSSLAKFPVGKSATVVLISALFSLVYIPFMINLFFKDLILNV